MDLSVPIVQPDLLAARLQMALSLGWHIVIACFGVGLPALILLAEWLGWRRGDATYNRLARRWVRVAGVLFAVGAVSGTILSFEMGILWPGLMGTFGDARHPVARPAVCHVPTATTGRQASIDSRRSVENRPDTS